MVLLILVGDDSGWQGVPIGFIYHLCLGKVVTLLPSTPPCADVIPGEFCPSALSVMDTIAIIVLALRLLLEPSRGH
jgi:hypothetical protein